MITTLLFLMGFSAHASAPIQDILDPSALDRQVDPCEDFYSFSCGGWQKNFKLPADKAGYWRQSNVLVDNVEENLNKILSDLPKTEVKASSLVNAKLGAFYQSCRAVSAPDVAGLNELKKRLSDLDNLKTPVEFAKRLAELSLNGTSGFFEFYNSQDPKDSSMVIAFVDRGGMSLPDPDYYLNDDAKSKEVRERYLLHVSKIMQIMGMSPAEAGKVSAMILGFETEMAKHALKKDDRRDMEKLFHPMAFKNLQALAPAIDWTTFIQSLGIKIPANLNVVEPDFIKAMNSSLEKMPAADRANFLKAKLINRSAYFIAGPLQDEAFAFWRQYLNGQKEMPPPWKYCTQIISGNMSEALGQAYLASIPGAKFIKKQTESMLGEIRAAFKKEIDTLTWMDAPTKAGAKKKLDKMGGKVGWPKKWRDYANLNIENGAFYKNELGASEYEVRRGLAKIGKKADRTEWDMSVWEPNAYYDGSNNEMVLPLGELVPPVFDPRFSEGANYGTLGGSTIGHELIHGFDDSGKDMDANGNYKTWWTDAAKKNFAGQAACYIQQTEAFEVKPGLKEHIRGKATLGENLADVAGVKLGLIALKKRMKTRKPAAKVDGFDEIQQFFVGYGQGWCAKMTDEKLREQLLTDFHPPSEFRVNQVLANQPEFAQAFHCKPGSKMAPKNRCTLW